MSATVEPAPPQRQMVAEKQIAVIWPSIAAVPLGRWIGQQIEAAPPWGWLHMFTVKNVWAVLLAPLGTTLYLALRLPFLCRRYVVTSRRVMIRHGMLQKQGITIPLDGFDTIQVEVLPGQAFYPAADLVFLQGDQPVLRLPGVPRAENFRHTCLKARLALIGIRGALARDVPH